MLILMMPMNAFASQTEELCSLTIEHPASDAEFSVYKVAEYSKKAGLEVVDPFNKYISEIKDLDHLEEVKGRIAANTWRTLAFTLQTYVTAGDIPENFTGKTDENGHLQFNHLERGLYLVLGDLVEIDEITYEASPALAGFPARDENGRKVEEVVIDYEGKLSAPSYEKVTAMKIWEDEGNEKYRPEEIEVGLYKDDEFYDDVILNEENNWEYTWTDLPQGVMWTVKEEIVPQAYKVSYTKEQDVTVIANTFEYPETELIPQEPEDSEEPSSLPSKRPGKIAQTGQLWWPVPILAILGIMFYSIGFTRRMYSGTSQMITGLVVLAAALVLTGYNIYESRDAGQKTAEVMQLIVEADEFEETDGDLLYEKFPEKEMPKVEISGEGYAGILEIPNLGLTLPVLGGEWSYPKLRKAPCLYAGSVYKDNMVVAAHNYPSHFGGLKNITLGSEVYFTDADGNRFTYTAAWMDVLKPTQGEELEDAKDWDLTLFTCTYGGRERYVLRCVREKI